MINDVHYWDTVAFIWCCDADTDAGREAAWFRFLQAYPEHQNSGFLEFWERILASIWYAREGHKHHKGHHKHEYC